MNSPPLPKRFASLRDLLALGRAFWLLFVAGVLSDLAGFASATALTLHVFHATGERPAMMGWVALAGIVPMMLAAPVGGVWAERYPRLRVMVGNDLFRVPVALAMIFASASSPWLLLCGQGLLSASTALFMPSRQSILPALLGDRVALGNAVNTTVVSFIHVFSPIVGAALYLQVHSLRNVLLFEAVAYAVSALLLLRIVEPPRASPAPARGALLAEIRAGLRYVITEPDLRQIFLMLLAAGVAFGLMFPLLRPFVGQALHSDDRAYGWIITWFGLGGIAGPLVGYWLGKRLGLGRTLLICFVADALTFTVWAQISNVYLSCAVLSLWGLIVFAMMPCYTSYVQTFAHPSFLGRTFGLLDQASYAPQILGALLVILFGNQLPTVAIFTVAGLGYLGVVLLTLPTRGARLLAARRLPPSPDAA